MPSRLTSGKICRLVDSRANRRTFSKLSLKSQAVVVGFMDRHSRLAHIHSGSRLDDFDTVLVEFLGPENQIMLLKVSQIELVPYPSFVPAVDRFESDMIERARRRFNNHGSISLDLIEQLVLHSHPEPSYDALDIFAKALKRNGFFEKSISVYEKLVRIQSGIIEKYVLRVEMADCYISIGLYGPGFQVLKEAKNISSTKKTNLLRAAAFGFRSLQERKEEEIEVLELLLKENSGDGAAIKRLGELNDDSSDEN